MSLSYLPNIRRYRSLDRTDTELSVGGDISSEEYKGDVVSVDSSDIRALLGKLSKSRRQMISRLTGEDKISYDKMVSCIAITHGTPSYQGVYTLIGEYFPPSSTPDPPGTVGAYFSGCIDQHNTDLGVCDPRCSSSVPAPGVSSSCDKNTIMGEHHGSGYTFKRLTTSNSSSDTILFLPTPTRTAMYYPLTQRDITTLKSMGVTTVTIYTYSPDSSDMTKVTTATHVESLTNNPNKSDSSIAVIVVIIFIILVIGAIYYASVNGSSVIGNGRIGY